MEPKLESSRSVMHTITSLRSTVSISDGLGAHVPGKKSFLFLFNVLDKCRKIY